MTRAPQTAHRPARIGLVTPRPEVVRLVRACLHVGTTDEFELFAVRSYFRGIDLLGARHVEVLISDTLIQGGTGVALLEAVASRADPDAVPVRVLLHHDDDPVAPPRPDLAPCDAVVRFPSQLDALAAMLRSLLGRRGHALGSSGSSPGLNRVARPRPTPVAPRRAGSRDAPQAPPPPAADEDLEALPELEVEPLDDEPLDVEPLDVGPLEIDAQPGRRVARPRATASVASSLLLAAPSLEAFVAEIERRAAALPGQTYHEILDLPPDAAPQLVRQVFDVASLRFHPDRNHAITEPTRRRALSTLYAAICEAYDVLTSPARRERYEHALSAGSTRLRDAQRERELRPDELSDHPGAQRFLRLAHQALADGDRKSALLNLRLAIDLDPDNARLDARLRQWQEASD